MTNKFTLTGSEDFDINHDLLESYKIKVLLVDDQQMIAEGIRRMLADEKDIEFHYCEDPTQAITVASDLQPTIILQDLVMPDIDGMTLVRFYRGTNMTKDIPIIVLSSKEDPAIKRDAFQSGANDYLVKLPDQIELIARIRSHAKQYMMQLERNAAFFALREMQKQLEKTNAKLEMLSSMDGLTGIANRRTFDNTLEQAWLQAQQEKTAISLILIDIDFFKAYNDNYGHQKGDECLCRVASALASIAARPSDLVARYGGEEFVIIASETDEDGAVKLSEKLQKAIATLDIPHEASRTSGNLTISMGLCTCYPDENAKSRDIIKFADIALYKAKDSGRNKAVVYQAGE